MSMGSPDTKESVLQIARRLYAAGIDVIWLQPRSKKPYEREWSTAPRKSWAALQKLYRSGMNMGIRVGAPSIVGGMALICIDVDIKTSDPLHYAQAYGAVEELLGDPSLYAVVTSGRGNGSKHIYALVDVERIPHTCKFRKSQDKIFSPEKKGLVPAWEVDVRSTGGQMVGPGSTHPSGSIYTELARLDTSLIEVPEQFYEAMDELPKAAVQTASITPIGPGGDVDLESLGLPEWLAILIRDGDVNDQWPSRSEAVGAAMVALAMHGADDHTICLVLSHPAYEISQKALSERRGIRKSAMEWIARQIPKARAEAERRKAEELPPVDLADDPDARALIEGANTRRAKVELIEPDRQETQQFPVHGLNDLARILDAGAHEYCDHLAQAAVMAVLSCAAAKRYRTEHGDSLHLRLCVLPQSISLVRHLKTNIHRLFDEAGFRHLIVSGRLSTDIQIKTALYRAPQFLWVADQYGSYLQQAQRQTTAYLDEMFATLADTFSGAPIYLNAPTDAGLKTRDSRKLVIRRPAPTIFAAVPTCQIPIMLRASEFGRGAIDQFIAVAAPTDPGAYRKPAAEDRPEPIPEWIKAHLGDLRDIHTMQSDDSGLLIEDPEHDVSIADTITVRFDPEASLQRAYDSIASITDDRTYRPFIASSRTNLRRVAACLAAWENPAAPAVTRPILDWSTAFITRNLQALIDQVALLTSDDGKMTPYQQVMMYLAERGPAGASDGDVRNKCWTYRRLKPSDREELIDTLLADDQIIPMRGTNGKGRRYVAKSFVKQEG